MKETRDIRCYDCGRESALVKNAQSGLWEYPEPGWALVNYSHLCPDCNSKLVARWKERNRLNREKYRKGM